MTLAARDVDDKLHLVLVNGKWHYRRRVPVEVEHLDKRGSVKKSTKQPLSRRAEAEIIARGINAATERYWSDLLDGSAPTQAEGAYTKAVARARRLGYTYRSVATLIAGPTQEILDRILELKLSGATASANTVEALLGTAEAPQVLLSKLHIRYFEVSGDRQRDQRGDTNRNWRNRRRRAVEMAVDQIGDKPVTELDRRDGLRLRGWLIDQVSDGAITASYANKIMANLSTMLREMSDKLELTVHDAFRDLKLSNAKDATRPPFPAAYVQDVLLGPTAMLGTNDEARAALALLASTGLRPIEVAFLSGENIRLDDPVPHLRIVDGLKTATSVRVMPLHGSALAAARAFPEGLPRYHKKQNQLTTALGAFMADNRLLPTSKHSLYSLRHTFKDRLRAVQCPDEIMDALMGHVSKKPAYGAGYPVAVLSEWVARAAFDAPKWLA